VGRWRDSAAASLQWASRTSLRTPQGRGGSDSTRRQKAACGRAKSHPGGGLDGASEDLPTAEPIRAKDADAGQPIPTCYAASRPAVTEAEAHGRLDGLVLERGISPDAMSDC
jgi:hypothetical protein